MLLSVIDELRTNTLSKVREIRVSNICERDLVTRKVFFCHPDQRDHRTLPSSFPHHFCSLCVSGRDGLQQRRAAVPPAGDREQRGRDVLRWSHGPAEGQEEEEEEEGAGHPDHRLNPYGHSGLFVYKHPLPISSQLSPEASRCWFLYVMNFWSDVTQCYSATRFISQINCIGLFLTVLQVLWGAFKTNKSSAAERNVVCIHSSSLCCCSSL